MNEPKRHHWLQDVHSCQLAGADVLLFVLRARGKMFRANRNVGTVRGLETQGC
jgi:hypothetical protein